MNLSNDLISQFVKVTNDKKETKTETTVYGTVKMQDGKTYVKIDGSDILTPAQSTAAVKAEERVTVMVKNHSAVIMGNISSPAASVDDISGLEDAVDKITEFEIIIAGKVDTDSLNAANARIDKLSAEDVKIKGVLDAVEANIEELQAEDVNISGKLTAVNADISKLKTDKLDANIAEMTFATIESLEGTNADLHNLEATYALFANTTTNKLTANEASITELENKKLDTETATITYANIDFSNIDNAAMEYFYARSGLIDSVVIGDGTITGNLVGVTITGDIIEGGTIIADKLVIMGEDGLYYKLNTNGETVSSEQTDYNSLNGRVITAKSITAEKVNVNDLVAFDATIGGFNITESSIYSEVKDTENNTTRGIYMDVDGQVNFGDANNYVKYYKDDNGNYHLAISADTIMYDLNGKQYSIADLGVIGEYVKIGIYEDEPCIELGETDSEFKVYITNTKILFVEGTGELAYFSNQSLYIKKAVIEEELQQGEFVWKARSNGNLGLIWRG